MKLIAPRISVDPEVGFGKPVIAGTRVPVSRIVGAVAAGDSWAEIAEQYGISEEDTRAHSPTPPNWLSRRPFAPAVDRVFSYRRGLTAVAARYSAPERTRSRARSGPFTNQSVLSNVTSTPSPGAARHPLPQGGEGDPTRTNCPLPPGERVARSAG